MIIPDELKIANCIVHLQIRSDDKQLIQNNTPFSLTTFKTLLRPNTFYMIVNLDQFRKNN